MISDSEVRQAVAVALDPRNFFQPGAAGLRIEHHGDQSCRWEIYRGHLLDPAATRELQTFETWTVTPLRDGTAAQAPLLAVHWSQPEQRLYVTRSLHVWAWEAYESSPGVIDSRPTQKWISQLVGRIALERRETVQRLHEELAHYLLLSLIGTSRLPITSIESPHPDYVFGELFYAPQRLPLRPVDSETALVNYAAGTAELLPRAKAVEMSLRSSSALSLAAIAKQLISAWNRAGRQPEELLDLCRTLFHQLALSPHTTLIQRLIDLLREFHKSSHFGPGLVIDLCSYLLRHLVRHLTAFDLVRFHQRGANYPDALLLDGLLKFYVQMVQQQPELFSHDSAEATPAVGRRLRALRQAWIMRRHYQGLPVPDVPTSSGEQVQVLPDIIPRIPQEQIESPARRRKKLYEADSLEHLLDGVVGSIFGQSLRHLECREELLELGLATYLDRPLGLLKEMGEVDRTPLLSYVAFSRRLARTRIGDLVEWKLLGEEASERLLDKLDQMHIQGWRVAALGQPTRAGVVALEDANQAADDFLFLHTTHSSLQHLLDQYDLAPLANVAPDHARWLQSPERKLLIRTSDAAAGQQGTVALKALNRQMQPALSLMASRAGGASPYGEDKGEEFLTTGIEVTEVWQSGVRSQLTGVRLLPKQG